MSVRLELAGKADEPALRRLMAQTPMGTRMQVAFHREPNFFQGSHVQGPFFQVTVARCVETREIVALGTRAIRPAFVNGRVQPVGYLADLRVRPSHRGGILLARGYRYLRELMGDGRASIHFTVIFEDNPSALGTIASGRAGLPVYQSLGRLLAPAIWLRKRLPSLAGSVEIVRGNRDLLLGIVECLNRIGERKQFSPFYRVEAFRPDNPWLLGLRPEDFIVARRDGRVCGVMAKWDQRGFKQTVVSGYGDRLRRLRPLVNLGAALGFCPPLPAPGRRIEACYGGPWAIDGDDAGVARGLLRQVYNDAFAAGFTYLLVGLHERDPLLPVLEDYARIPFAGHLFAVAFPDQETPFERLDGRVPHIEIATL